MIRNTLNIFLILFTVHISFGQEHGNWENYNYDRLIELAIDYQNIDQDSAIMFAQKAVDISKDDSENKAKAFGRLSQSYRSKGNYDLASVYSIKALELYEDLDHYYGMGDTYCSLGNLSVAKQDNDKGREYYNLAKEISAKHDLQKIGVLAEIGIGNCYYYDGEIEIAKENYLAALDLLGSEKTQSAEVMAGLFINLGNIAYFEDDYSGAISYYEEGKSVYERLGHNKGLSLALYNIGNNYLELGTYDSSIYYFEQSLKVAEDIGSIEDIMYAYYGIKVSYFEDKDYKNAYHYAELHHEYQDSLYQLEEKKNADQLAVIYDTKKNNEKLTQQNEELQQAYDDMAAEEEFNSVLINILIFLGVALSMFLISFYQIKRKNRTIQLQNERIKNKNNTIDKTLKEKELLLKEIHHRVKNNLQMISSLLNLQTYSLKNDFAIKALNDSKNRVQAIALVHKKLYQDDNISEVNLHEYVSDLIDFIGNRDINNYPITYTINIGEILVNTDTAVPLGLIITELISNSMKHAFSNEENCNITISITLDKTEGVILEFSDNGKGLPDNLDLENLDSLGFEIINTLIEQLHGNMLIDTSQGTQFKISLKRAV